MIRTQSPFGGPAPGRLKPVMTTCAIRGLPPSPATPPHHMYTAVHGLCSNCIDPDSVLTKYFRPSFSSFFFLLSRVLFLALVRWCGFKNHVTCYGAPDTPDPMGEVKRLGRGKFDSLLSRCLVHVPILASSAQGCAGA